MKVSLNLIKQLTRVKLGEEELLKRINSRLAEVEEVENLADQYEGVLVAEIKEAKAHPDADKLGVYQVFNGKDTIQVVAGDKKLQVGDKVAHIAPGLTVPSTYNDEEPFVLESRKLRGETSNGMLGSAKELDFGDDHDNVLKLDTEKPAGTTLIEAYDLDDQIIEVENKTLTHRPDCFGLIGFAREIAGIQDLKFESPEWLLKTAKIPKSSDSLKLSVNNEVPKDCPTYLAVAMEGVEIKQSPVFLMTYLNRIGVRPINNIVDMTNYWMVMTGQPLHAFDYDKVKNGKITIRYPKKGEKLTLLDGKEIEIHKKAVTICDDNGPIALGGVMGGANSEISDDTKNIVIECANFDMYSVRRTSMDHGIFSDAATRFMRGQSPALCEKVLKEVLNHPEDLGGAKLASEIIGGTAKTKEIEVSVKYDDVNALLGINMAADEQKRRLQNVEIQTSGNKVKVPFWRRDLNIWQDIAEEIGRLSGFDNVEMTVPSRSVRAVDYGELEKLKQTVRSVLVAAGASEVLTYSGVSADLVDKMGLNTKRLYRLRNSISPELEYMRAALGPSLLEKAHPNHRRGVGEFVIFEIGKTHSKDEVKGKLPVEQERLGLVFSADDKVAQQKYEGAPYYMAKKYLEHLLDSLGVRGVSFKELSANAWPDVRAVLALKKSAAVFVGEENVGVVGEFANQPKRNLKLRDYSAGFEIDLSRLLKVADSSAKYERLSRYPGSEHDVTFETPQKVSFAQVQTDFAKEIFNKDELRGVVDRVDAYQKNDDSKTKNLTFRVKLSNTSKTMSSDEINAVVDNAVNTVSKKLGLKRI